MKLLKWEEEKQPLLELLFILIACVKYLELIVTLDENTWKFSQNPRD